jgi:hypothetical protein
MADAGYLLGGKRVEILFGLGQNIVLLFISAAHINGFTIMMNVLTGHATCSVYFSLVALAVCFFCTLPRTLKAMAWLSCACKFTSHFCGGLQLLNQIACISIMMAIMIVMVHVGVVKPHPNSTVAFPESGFVPAMTSALNIVLAYSGHVTYFGFFSELKDPREFKKSLVLLQTTAIAVYTTVAVVIYNYVGPGVKAPALSSAAPRISKIAYGVAIPTIIIAGVLNAHVASSAFYRWAWKRAGKADVYKEKSTRALVSWIGIVLLVWLLAWVIAESIPIFEYLLALVSALFSGWYSCKWLQFFLDILQF